MGKIGERGARSRIRNPWIDVILFGRVAKCGEKQKRAFPRTNLHLNWQRLEKRETKWSLSNLVSREDGRCFRSTFSHNCHFSSKCDSLDSRLKHFNTFVTCSLSCLKRERWDINFSQHEYIYIYITTNFSKHCQNRATNRSQAPSPPKIPSR